MGRVLRDGDFQVGDAGGFASHRIRLEGLGIDSSLAPRMTGSKLTNGFQNDRKQTDKGVAKCIK